MSLSIQYNSRRAPSRINGTDAAAPVCSLTERRLANLDTFLNILRDAAAVRFHSERREQLRRFRGAATGAQGAETYQPGSKDTTPLMMISTVNVLLAIGPDAQLQGAINQLIDDLTTIRGHVENHE